MGNQCFNREEVPSPQEDLKKYTSCLKLWNEVCWRLGDEAELRRECAEYFQEACARRDRHYLTKDHFREMTSAFIEHVSLRDPRRRDRLLRMIDELCPGNQLISEELFTQCTLGVMSLAERDLREEVDKIKQKYDGPPPGAVPSSAPSHPGVAQPPPSQIFTAASDAQIQKPVVDLVKVPSNDRIHVGQLAGVGSISQVGAPIDLSTSSSLTPTVSASRIDASHMYQSPDPTVAQTLETTGPVFAGSVDFDHRRPADGLQPLNPRAPNLSTSVRAVDDPTKCAKDVYAQKLFETRRQILTGNLCLSVFNNELRVEPKRLAFNSNRGRLSLLNPDGLCDDSWEVANLRCLTLGVNSAIPVAEAPPADRAMSFCFYFPSVDADVQEFVLCSVFDTAEACSLASKALGEVCNVPVYDATTS